jgi:hypothetical protein
MWFCKMLVLYFHRKWLICWIQFLLLLARTFIVGPDWQRESCVTAVLWTARVLSPLPNSQGARPLSNGCQEYSGQNMKLTTSPNVFVAWYLPRDSNYMKWPLSKLYFSVSFVWKLWTSCILIDLIIGPDSKIKVKAVVDDCVI